MSGVTSWLSQTIKLLTGFGKFIAGFWENDEHKKQLAANRRLFIEGIDKERIALQEDYDYNVQNAKERAENIGGEFSSGAARLGISTASESVSAYKGAINKNLTDLLSRYDLGLKRNNDILDRKLQTYENDYKADRNDLLNQEAWSTTKFATGLVDEALGGKGGQNQNYQSDYTPADTAAVQEASTKALLDSNLRHLERMGVDFNNMTFSNGAGYNSGMDAYYNNRKNYWTS